MKRRLLDERGRLMGKVNLIDLLIIGFFLLLLPGGYFLRQTLKQTPKQTAGAIEAQKKPEPGIVPVMVTVEFRGVYSFVRDLVKPGDGIRSARDRVVGRIAEIVLDESDGGYTHHLRLKVHVLAKPTPQRRYVFISGSQILKVGSGFYIETDKYVMSSGIIVSFEVLEGGDSLEL